jgi:hypothetical protein
LLNLIDVMYFKNWIHGLNFKFILHLTIWLKVHVAGNFVYSAESCSLKILCIFYLNSVTKVRLRNLTWLRKQLFYHYNPMQLDAQSHIEIVLTCELNKIRNVYSIHFVNILFKLWSYWCEVRSISSTFYEQLFRAQIRKVLERLFCSFGICNCHQVNLECV